MSPLAALGAVPIVTALVLAVLAFSGWVYAMIRIDSVTDALALDRARRASSEESAVGERAWLEVPPVRPGGVCQVPGAVGSTATGVAMICTPEADGTARSRWRQPTSRSAWPESKPADDGLLEELPERCADLALTAGFRPRDPGRARHSALRGRDPEESVPGESAAVHGGEA